MNLDTARMGLSLLEQGEDFAWTAILVTHGSSPRHTGASMLVRVDGSISGTIGGGPLEATCIAQAVDAIRTHSNRLVQFDSAELGMACGGGGRVLIESVQAGRPGTADLLRAIVRLWELGTRGWLVTSVPQEQGLDAPIRRCLVHSDGSVTGEPVCEPEDLQVLAERGGTYDRLLADDPARIHIQSIGANGKAYVFGAGHCSHSLVPVLSALAFFTVVVDDRSDFASRERFPTADQIHIPRSFDNAVAPLSVDEDSYLVIVTRGHNHDRSVLAQALRTPAAYIGMIGSKKKVAATFAALSEEGFSKDELARVHAPIGLPIGAETPEEIAISIAAELIQVRAAKNR